MTIEELVIKITADAKGLAQGLGDARRDMSAFEGETRNWGSRLNKAANWGIGGLAAMGAVIGKSVATYKDVGSGIREVTRLTDISTEAASLLSGQWQRFGIDASAGASGVKFFARNLAAARKGSTAQAEAFEALGLSLADLKSMSDEDVLFATRDALADMGPSAERTNIALTLLGRGGAALMPWLSASSGDMAALNDELERSGLVWGDDELQRWAEAQAAQREMQIALTGIQVVIARDVVPWLTRLIEALGWVLDKVRPLAPVLVPATAALAGFVGVVKGISVVQSTIDIVRNLTSNIGAARDAARTARDAFGGIGKMLPGLGEALATNAVQWGLVSAAAALAAYAVWEAYDAAKSYYDMLDKVNEMADQNLAAIDKLIAKYESLGRDTSGLKKQRQQIIDDAKVDTPWYYYLNPMYDLMDTINWLGGMASGGTVKARPGGSLALLAEAGVDEDVVPADKRVAYAESILGRGDVSINVHISQLVGADERAARSMWDSLRPVVMGELRAAEAMGRG